MTATMASNPYGIVPLPGWRETTLGQLVDNVDSFIQTGPFGSQLHAHDYKSDGVPVVMPQQLGDNRINLDGIARISDEDRDRLSRHILRVGDIVFSRRGDVTRRALITSHEDGYLCGTGCLLIRLSHPDVDNRYLSLFFSLRQFKEYIIQKAVGATMPNLNTGILERIPIVLPPVDDQRRIVEVLSAYDELIENNRRRMALLEESARLLYQEWFVRLRFPGHEHVRIVKGVPEGWEKKPLKELCPDLRDAAHPADLEPGTPYIGLEHIPRRSITLLEWGEAEDVTSTKLRYQAGDILFGKIRPYFHKVGFALTDGVASSDAIVLRPTEPAFYVFSLLTVSSDWFVTIVSKTAKEGSKMPRADWKLMENHELAVPPLGLLESLNEIIRPMLDQLRTLAFQNQKLCAARDLLLPRLMSGEVV